MPDFNQRGPMGQGPMTGRRMGNCANMGANFKNQTAEEKENANENTSESFQGRNFEFGQSRGQGRGLGRGRGGSGMRRQNRFRGGF